MHKPVLFFLPSVEKILLTPAERAVYLELDHHLQAMEMKAKKSVKSKKTTEGDRETRLRDMLGASGSAEEALLKRCSHYDLAGKASEFGIVNLVGYNLTLNSASHQVG